MLKPRKMRRRDFLVAGSLAFVAGAAITSGYLYLNDEAQTPVVDRVPIPIKNLPPAFEGFTIAVLADFHLYPLTQPEVIQKAVVMANSLNPDLTVLLGDYVWHEVEAIFDLAPMLAQLNAKHGVFSIIGNHDIWTNLTIVTKGLTDAGLPILVNEGFPITVGQDSLYLAALDDGWSGNPDLQAAMANHKNYTPTVLLYHEPDLADDTSLDGRISLQLSGHSHGGQIRFPGVGALITPYLAWKYDQGLYKVNDMWLYTNRGIGVTNEPIRYNCPPEVTEIVLVGA
jgi:predicted MPP superfamily phosphohydrolase